MKIRKINSSEMLDVIIKKSVFRMRANAITSAGKRLTATAVAGSRNSSATKASTRKKIGRDFILSPGLSPLTRAARSA